MYSVFLLTLTLATAVAVERPQTNEEAVQACIADCIATYDEPGYELKACVTKCQELGEAKAYPITQERVLASE